jgi:diaminohydroxyphosphoribosylaminopyrimidine deaminase/5-amino-6-(5-phosphoribosylamino)uracil reductase
MPQAIDYMRRCFVLAEHGSHSARPNPMVGCVIVSDDAIVGEGWHLIAGAAHAEINALEQAGARASGATAYVSLEPCAHHGKTGPCAEALIRSGVSRVVYAMEDPNPQVSGRGLAMLRAAGIAVEGPLLAGEAAALNPGFIKRMHEGMPYVRCKMAMSLDGRTAMHSGESKWITGAQARADVQQLRARSCAVLTGVATLLRDDAALNVRLPGFTGRQPLRVIVDSQLRTPLTATTLQVPGEVLLVCARPAPAAFAALEAAALEAGQASLTIRTFAAADGRVDLRQLLRFLAIERQCNEVLVEAGATLGGALLQTALVDELITYVAPALLGNDARPLFTLPGMQHLADSIRLEFLDVAMVGKDCRMRSRVLRAP